ncbi:hypothetical protein SAMD00019534_064330, partial [Acytostelium subglobosum LB1]|uniref:hypothetical protein n=1 Tax=Acytostelium subglobosum LB1 TaxID=1410327 RepID=UPI000644F340
MYITTNKELTEYCTRLMLASAVGFDTEFDHTTTYAPRLCLIQVTTSSQIEDVAVIDPIVNKLDLTPLRDVFLNGNIAKVFHDARRDLDLLYRVLKVLPVNVFDTQLAAAFCGLKDRPISYKDLVKRLFNHDIDKSFQRADWLARPLSQDQLHYAKCDVVYLLPAYQMLHASLINMNRWEWMLEEMRLMSDPQTFAIDKTRLWVKTDFPKDSPNLNLAVVQDVCVWRESNANSFDIPRKTLLRDDCIQTISTNVPATREELIKMAQSPVYITNGKYMAHSLFECIQLAAKRPRESWPVLHERKEADPERDYIRQIRDGYAKQLNIPCNLLATDTNLREFTKGVYSFEGWRSEFGQFLKLSLDAARQQQQQQPASKLNLVK